MFGIYEVFQIIFLQNSKGSENLYSMINEFGDNTIIVEFAWLQSWEEDACSPEIWIARSKHRLQRVLNWSENYRALSGI